MSLSGGVALLATKVANYLRDSVLPRLVPRGGIAGQTLVKGDATDFNATWGAISVSSVTGLQAALDDKQATLSYATASDIWAGTDTGKIVTAKVLRDAQVPQTLAASATPAWNAALGFNAKITLTANTTFQTPTNLVEGLTYVLRVKQDATGGRTGSYTSAFNFGADNPPTLSTAANAEDVLTFLCVDAATPRLSFVGIKKGF